MTDYCNLLKVKYMKVLQRKVFYEQMDHFTLNWVLNNSIRYIEIGTGAIFWKLGTELR